MPKDELPPLDPQAEPSVTWDEETQQYKLENDNGTALYLTPGQYQGVVRYATSIW